MMREDFSTTAQAIADIGYRSVELAGYGNLSASDAAIALKNAGLTVVGMHAGIDRLRNELGEVLCEAELFHSPFITCSSYPKDVLQTPEQCEDAGQELNQIGALVRERGRRFAFHNHGLEFENLESRPRIDWMLRAAEPRNLEMELDVYWSTLAGVDTVGWLRQHGSRITQVHLKDEKELGASGRVHFPAILATLSEIGANPSLIIEQEEYSYAPLESARLCLQTLQGWYEN